MFSLEGRQAARDSLWGTQSGEWDARAVQVPWLVGRTGLSQRRDPRCWVLLLGQRGAQEGSSGTGDELLSPTPAPLKQVPSFSCFPTLGSSKSSKGKNVCAELEPVSTGMWKKHTLRRQADLRLNPGFAITHHAILRQGQLPDV